MFCLLRKQFLLRELQDKVFAFQSLAELSHPKSPDLKSTSGSGQSAGKSSYKEVLGGLGFGFAVRRNDEIPVLPSHLVFFFQSLVSSLAFSTQILATNFWWPETWLENNLRGSLPKERERAKAQKQN